ncbi:TonB-dependent receptor [Gaoshiqia sp. Z1-71]|uniref:TonB-dependent receptor n=1 Tax=Gaoshiqia hydrogeniformans TaxID=3290090 RepID=UPI003BF7C431
MKLTTLLLLVTFISLQAKVYSQSADLNLKVQNTTVKDVLRDIEDQSEFFFMYNDREVDVNRLVNLELQNKKIDEVLNVLFDGTTTKYLIKDRQIVLYSNDEKPANNLINQQVRTVTGKVTDTSGAPLPGVSIVVKGTTTGTLSDFDGNYNLNNLPEGAVLVFSFVGMKRVEAPVNQSVVNVVLEEETIGLEEVVAIGYGTMKRKDITGSVASVKGEDLAAIPVASAAEAITGKLAGVQVLSTEGSPDAEMRIRVRGGGSITQDNTPLFIVDGFPVNSISDIAMSDIQSIDVLKDASSTAIYGSRGANGVIIVTTKSGVAGKVSVSYNSYFGFKRIAKTLDVLDVEDYVNWQYEHAVLDDGIDNLGSYEKYYGAWQDKDMYVGQKGNNWQKQVYGRTGEVFNHDLSIRGGSDKISYSFNYAHIDEKAIMIGSDFKRDNLSFKLNHNPNSKVQLAFSFRYSDTKINGGGANEQNEVSSADSRLKHSVTYSPIPLGGLTTDDTDEAIAGYLQNPLVAAADNDREQMRKNYNMAASFSWELIQNLQFKTEVGLDNFNNNDNRFYGLTTYYIKNAPASENQGYPALILRDRKQERIRNTNTLTYDFKKVLAENHNLKLLVAHEMVETNTQELTSVLHGFPKLFTFDQALKLTTQGKAYSTDNNYSPDDKLLSFFGRANYDFKSKYLLSATFRADGSSKFSNGNRWGYFPSAAAAWRISEENFMQQSSSWLDDLKLRLSYGTAGNNNIPSGQMAQSFESGTSAWINGIGNFWSASKTMANPDLKWETTYTRNIGLDFALFNSRLSGTIEAYLNNTKDLLIEFPVAGTGYNTQYRNMGETRNKGLEVSLNWSAIEKKDYGLSFNFNIGFNKNKIKSLGIMEDFGAATGWASTEIGDDFWIAKGGSVGKMYGFRSDGRYEVSDFEGYNATTNRWILKEGVVDATAIVGNPAPGLMKLKNISGEDNLVTVDDREIIGDANPLHTGGFTINGRAYGFDLTAVFNWSYGNDVYNANKIEYTSSTPRYQYRNFIDMMGEGKRWTNIDPTTGDLVTDLATLGAMNANTTMWSPYMARFVFSDWAVEDGSFLRLNTLTLGYTLPSSMTKKMKIQNLRFYATGYNVFLITNYSGFDPEVSTRRKTALTPGVDYSAYPRSRQIVFGLNLNF